MRVVNQVPNEYVPSQTMDYLGIHLEATLSKASLDSELSYFSTSTTTVNDNPGTGRVLDKFVFQKGGRAVERYMGLAAHAVGFGPAAVAQRIGNHLRGFSLELREEQAATEDDGEAGHVELRLDLALVQDVDRLRADCRKLFFHTIRGPSSRRKQALRLIILLFIRFPYLRYYFDSREITERLDALLAKNKRLPMRPLEDEDVLADLSQMAYACLLPGANSVARLIDHLAERMKYAEANPRGPQSTGPFSGYLPDPTLIRNCCTNPEASFASIRFAAILFRHSFLTCGPTFFVKLNRLSAHFWKAIIDVARYRMSLAADAEGTELFMLTILEMIHCSISWDENFEAGRIESDIVDSALKLYENPLVRILLPQSSRFSLSLSRRWVEAKVEYQAKLDSGELERLGPTGQDLQDDSDPQADSAVDDGSRFDRSKCDSKCKADPSSVARGGCENCSHFLTFSAVGDEDAL